MIILAAAAAITGCGIAAHGYTVEGGTNEQSLVSDESFAAMYATMACAQDEEMDGSWTEYEGSSYAAAESEAEGTLGKSARLSLGTQRRTAGILRAVFCLIRTKRSCGRSLRFRNGARDRTVSESSTDLLQLPGCTPDLLQFII